MLCKNCGEYNDEGNMYCQYCGGELENADSFENYGSGYGAQPSCNSQPNYSAQQNYGAQPVSGGAAQSAPYAAAQQPQYTAAANAAADDGNVYTRQPYANSYFDGNAFQLIGWDILTCLIGAITLGFGIPWTICLKLRWETQHTVVNGKRLYFNGTAAQLFGKMILWDLILLAMGGLPFLVVLLPMATSHARASAMAAAFTVCIVIAALVALFGGAFYMVYIKKWIIKHTTYVADTGNYYVGAASAAAVGSSPVAPTVSVSGSRVCSQCGTVNSDDSGFCIKCGARF